ncbi:methyltransferase small [Beutenbergia cavernae DSM 12333]|uniref:Methyltransferase small n=1 Tax=Beutenbergia cavernae (strain ATCC BAA-8 / DSM 12333 / CCUG 43141 / JCM 11478 / NBRC 16432 / NCIMB 13614 / HKI 0122) TaxID=471853 RepID=C5BWM1_BEUC1|nr:methyltransferase [Beutenbergia cavernae]ACQ80687.1 methyltransferase small [Beutenbergia cavernae DSM 12333]
MSAPDHYFSAEPAAPDERRTIDVRLRGRDVRVTTAPGVFSADHLDTGTRVLLDAVPAPPATGELLDLGCGWGPLALAMAAESPGARVWAVDVNDRALDLVRVNAAAVGAAGVRAATPDEALTHRPSLAVIWSNPPIRIGKRSLHDLLATWLDLLAPDGEAWLVVAKNLGADSLQRWIATELGFEAERTASVKGFRVLKVTRRA